MSSFNVKREINSLIDAKFKKNQIKSGSLRKLYVLSAFTAFVNCLYYDNATIIYIFAVFEVAVLLHYAFKRDMVNFIGLYAMFCCMSAEYANEYNSDIVYSFKEIHFAGINLGLLILIPAIIFISAYKLRISFVKKKSPTLSKFSKWMLFLTATGFVMGIFMIIVNDNNISSMDNIITGFLGVVYEKALFPLLFVYIFYFIRAYQSNELVSLEQYFKAILTGLVLYLLFAMAFNRMGIYGGVSTLACPKSVRWIPLILLLPLYDKYKGKIYFWIIGLLGMYPLLKYNATGKTVILYVLIPIIYAFVYVKKRQWKKVVAFVICAPIILIIIVCSYSNLSDSSIMFSSKLMQAKSLLNLFSPKASISSIASSPLFRVNEIINTTYEYMSKPYYFLFGKGYMGTFIDRVGMPYAVDAYHAHEWQLGIFYNVHETLARLYLSNGLVGVLFIIWIIQKTVKNIHVNPWLLLGVYWFLIAYGHSITMTSIGLPCLLYGLIQIDVYNDKNTNLELLQ